MSKSVKSHWANQACVTTLSLSRSTPKAWGVSAMTTTAFWTVDRVTSAGRLMSFVESSWRVHEIPNREVGGPLSDSGRRRVK